METTTAEAPKMQTRRDLLLQTYGPGPRLCLDGAANWLGCDARCEQSCILSAGHQLDKAEIERRRAELLAAREAAKKQEQAARRLNRFEKHSQALRARKAIARKPQASGKALDEAIAAVPAADLLPAAIVNKKCGICMVVMKPVMGRWVCPKCGGVLTPRAAS